MGECQERQFVEVFHLHFLRQLGSVLDRSLYAVKGGCNLRFFLNSIRYSEDLDIDTQIIAKGTLQNKVRQLFASASFIHSLRAKGLSIASFTEPKQTDTTQRFKVMLAVSNRTLPLHTKIEFSRRGIKDETAISPLSTEISRLHALPVFLIPHYTALSAFSQKLDALVNRSETQARDVFDLIHLLKHGVRPSTLMKSFSPSFISKAQSLVMGMRFEDFKAQVVAYLEPDFQKVYDSKSGVDALSLELVEALEEMKP